MLLRKAVALTLVSMSVVLAQDASSVRTALGVLNRVVNHTQRLITAKNFARLPHEDGEFKEGVEALEKAIQSEPTAFQHKVEPLIKLAEERSHALASASGEKDTNSAHDALTQAVEALVAAFPENERPTAAAAK